MNNTMAAGCEYNLQTCLEQIHQIFEDEKRRYKEKVSKLEEEKTVLCGLLENRNVLEKENSHVKTENKLLKEEISLLRLTSNESQSKLIELENKYEVFRKNVTKKQSEWTRFVHTVRKKCSCKFKDSLKRSDYSLATPTIKLKNVSNVFFMSPVKNKSYHSGYAALAPMTEEYNLHTPTGAIKASTPLIVGETEKSPCLHYNVVSSGNESDEEWLSSPSLFTDNESKMLEETPKHLKKYKEKKLKNIPLVPMDSCKPSPIDGFALRKQCNENLETSAVLFSDNSRSNTEDNCKSKVDFHKVDIMSNEKQSRQKKTDNTEEKLCKNEKYKESSCSISKKSKYMPEMFAENVTSVGNVNNIKNDTGNTVVKEDGIVDLNNGNKIADGNYKYSVVIRKKQEREKLNGYACEECKRYYQSDNLTKERLEEVLKHCSKHKHLSSPPPSTPEQFWALDFPQTQDCIDKGYMLDENKTLPDYAKPKWKKVKRKKTVKFE